MQSATRAVTSCFQVTFTATKQREEYFSLSGTMNTFLSIENEMNLSPRDFAFTLFICCCANAALWIIAKFFFPVYDPRYFKNRSVDYDGAEIGGHIHGYPWAPGKLYSRKGILNADLANQMVVCLGINNMMAMLAIYAAVVSLTGAWEECIKTKQDRHGE